MNKNLTFSCFLAATEMDHIDEGTLTSSKTFQHEVGFLTCGATDFLGAVRVWPEHCRMWTSIPSLCPPHASTIPSAQP